jgi:hypothetical protein
MTTIKFFLPVLVLLCVTTASVSAQNSNNPKVWIIINYVKEKAKVDYEKWMTDIFFAPMQTTQDTTLKKQYATARWLTPVQQNEDKTWTYCFLLDPVVPKADYDIEHYLIKIYGDVKAKELLKQYEDFSASGQIHVFNSSK